MWYMFFMNNNNNNISWNLKIYHDMQWNARMKKCFNNRYILLRFIMIHTEMQITIQRGILSIIKQFAFIFHQVVRAVSEKNPEGFFQGCSIENLIRCLRAIVSRMELSILNIVSRIELKKKSSVFKSQY